MAHNDICETKLLQTLNLNINNSLKSTGKIEVHWEDWFEKQNQKSKNKNNPKKITTTTKKKKQQQNTKPKMLQIVHHHIAQT